MFIFARLFALAGFIILVVQILLTSRLPIFKPFGPYDRLTKVHKTGGKVAAVLILAHILLIGAAKIMTGDMSVSPFTLPGIVSAVLLAAAIATAWWYKRWSMKYEAWRGLHLVIYIAFGLAFIHAIYNGTYLNTFSGLRVLWSVLAAIVAFILLWRIFRVVRMASRPLTVDEIVPETHDTTTVRFEGKPFSHRAGQFMFVRFPGKKKLKGTHPFTISAPPESRDLTITVKAVGDFTGALPSLWPGAKAWVEGPYGGFTFPVYRGKASGRKYKALPPFVFIAGGIGITPFLRMLGELASAGTAASVLLIWGNKSERDILRREEIESFRSRIHGFSVVHVLSDQPEWKGETGFIDLELLKRHVTDWDNSVFYLCGPPVMMRKLLDAFSTDGVPMDKIKWERFAL